MFSNLSQPQTGTTQSSLFGTPTQNQNTGNSLFGNSAQNKSQNTPQTSNLFGGANTNTNTPQGSSLFGNTNANASASKGNNLFGGNQQNQSQTGNPLVDVTNNPQNQKATEVSRSEFSLNGGTTPWNCVALRRKIKDFVTHSASEDLSGLDDTLKNFYDLLKNPLHVKPKSPTDRTKVEQVKQVYSEKTGSGKPFAVNTVEILRMADSINMNEDTALSLWVEACHGDCQESLEMELDLKPGTFATQIQESSRKVNPDSAIGKIALSLFYLQRRSLLQSISDLLRLRNSSFDSNDLSQAKQDFIMQFTDRLLCDGDGLVKTFLNHIRTINTTIVQMFSQQSRTQGYTDVHLKHLQYERRVLAECVFLLFYHTIAEPEEALAVVQMCIELSNRWVTHEETTRNANEASSSYECLYLLLLSFACICDWKNKLYDRKDTPQTGELKSGGSVLSENINWITQMDTLLNTETRNTNPSQNGNSSSNALVVGSNNGGGILANTSNSGINVAGAASDSKNWRHDGVHGVCLFVWGMFLSKLPPQNFHNLDLASKAHRIDVLRWAFECRAIAFLRGILRSPELASDELKLLVVNVVDDFFCVNYIVLADADDNDGSLAADDDAISTSEELLRPRTQLIEEDRLRHQHQRQHQQQSQAYHGSNDISSHGNNQNHYAHPIGNRGGLYSSPGHGGFGIQGGLGGGYGIHSVYGASNSSNQALSRNASMQPSYAHGSSGLAMDFPSYSGDNYGVQGNRALNQSKIGAFKTNNNTDSSQDVGDDIGCLSDSIEDFLALIGLVCSIEPSLAKKYWRVGETNPLGSSAMNTPVSSVALSLFADSNNSSNGGVSGPQKAVGMFIPKIQARVETHNDPQSLYVSFINFLAALASDPDCAKATFRHLRTQQPISWSTLIQALRHYSSFQRPSTQQQYQFQSNQMGMGMAGFSQQQNQNRTSEPKNQKTNVSDADQLVLCCWIRLLRSVAKTPEVCNEILTGKDEGGFTTSNQSPDWNVDELLLGLLGSNLKPALKAQITYTLSALSQSEPVAQMMWDKVEHKQILRTYAGASALTAQNTSNNGAVGFSYGGIGQQSMNNQTQSLPLFDVRADLNTKETSEYVFPYTLSFLELLWRMVSNGWRNTRYEFLGTGKDAGIFPYLEFAMEDVFLKYDQRSYRNSGDTWRVAASVLRIFFVILDRYNVNSETAQSDFSDKKQKLTQMQGTKVQNSGSGGTDGGGKSFSAGFWMMTQILQGGAFFKKLIELIHLAGGAEGVENAKDQRSGTQSRRSSGPDDNLNGGGNFNNINDTNTGGRKPWYFVSCNRQNLDLRKAKRRPSNRGGYGLMRIRQTFTGPTRVAGDDSGEFASWLVIPQIEGWSNSSPAHGDHGASSGTEEIRNYSWDDGDPTGYWREYACKLALRLLVAASDKEDWFVSRIRSTNTMLDDRLERLHRMLLFRRDCIFALTSFVRYPYSREMNLLAVKLIFRISAQAKHGALVKEFINSTNLPGSRSAHDLFLIDGLRWCLEQSQDMLNPSPFEDSIEDIIGDDGSNRERSAENVACRKLRPSVLQLLLDSLSQPKGNLAHLVLGFKNITIGSNSNWRACVNSLNKQRTCLHVILDILDNQLVFETEDIGLVEQMYELVFRLCDSNVTGYAMCYLLREQKDNFWLRHFEHCHVRQQEKAEHANIVSWILKGLSVDLKVASVGEIQSSMVAQRILTVLYTPDVDVTKEIDVEQTQIRIIEVLESIPLDSQFAETTGISDAPSLVKKVLTSTATEQPGLLEPFAQYNGHLFYLLDIGRMATILGDKVNSDVEAKEALEWSLNWNNEQKKVAARAHLILGWTRLVQVSLVECAVDGFGSSKLGQANVFEVISTILNKLIRQASSPPALVDPLAATVMSLIWQLRVEDLKEISGGSSLVPGTSTDHHIKILVGLLGALHKKSKVSAGGSRASSQMRRCLYAGLVHLLQGSRTYYAQIMKILVNPGSIKNTENPLNHSVPERLSEQAFLASTASVSSFFGSGSGSNQSLADVSEIYRSKSKNQKSVTFADTQEGGSRRHNNEDPVEAMHSLRNRAVQTLEALESSGRGDALWEMAAGDSMDASDAPTRSLALSVLNTLFPCDRTGNWLRYLRHQGVLRHFVSVTTHRVIVDALDAPLAHYLSVVSVLLVVAQTRQGAIELIESGILSQLHEKSLTVFCDKRALNDQETREIRHDIVLPILRLIVTIFTTLSQRSHMHRQTSVFGNGGEEKVESHFGAQIQNNFTIPVMKFLRSQRRMITSALGFPSTTPNDLEETTLIVSILSHCAKFSELGDVLFEFDHMMFTLMCEYSSKELEKDVQLLKHIIAYCRKRNPLLGVIQLERQFALEKQKDKKANGSKGEKSKIGMEWDKNTYTVSEGEKSKIGMEWDKKTYTVASDVNALIMCIDESCKALLENLKNGEKQRDKDVTFVLEGALSVLYVKVRELRVFSNADRVKNILRQKNLMSLEELERETKNIDAEKSKYIKIMLRNIRNLSDS